MRRKRPLERSGGAIRDATLVVIASEDRYAVKQYFEFFRSTRVRFKVLETDDTQSSPAKVMQRLEHFMKEFDFGEGDQFWLVCDRDHWADAGHIHNLVDVVKRCRQKGIGVALSSPCFELWLLLHFVDFPQTDLDRCSEVAELLRNAVGRFDKRKVYDLPISTGGVEAAIARSKAQFSEKDLIPTCPQTAVHLIVEGFAAAGIIEVRQ